MHRLFYVRCQPQRGVGTSNSAAALPHATRCATAGGRSPSHRRAQIVAKQLEVMGAKPAQVEAVSYGEERPKATGHDEAAWAENRRADIRYTKR